ncbi:membrane-associated proteins in eicosanoid and glutathione metabolism [Dendrothele bispora CBS 962.96]|uniref:Membrane-associated proteins in eicosanoid and glutathione metabolism n=1 Tax=Dendrothele bispora (strain CBS 962.96) TaxID=1314807 RepID=A0A4S8LVJ7_DENBC|nr:membrane-associated proteins in eicosanoid and glutathione metabolism [Dendrothele bispora CBS 962.96]
MSTTTFVGLNLPKEMPYVGLALVSTLHLLVYQSFFCVAPARHKAGVKYPRIYADYDEAEKSLEKMKFNCYQRAHQNTLESLPIVWLSTIVTGSKYPVFAAAACGLWVLSRFEYTRTYGSGKPERRAPAAYTGILITLSLILSSTYVSAKAALDVLNL